MKVYAIFYLIHRFNNIAGRFAGGRLRSGYAKAFGCNQIGVVFFVYVVFPQFCVGFALYAATDNLRTHNAVFAEGDDELAAPYIVYLAPYDFGILPGWANVDFRALG